MSSPPQRLPDQKYLPSSNVILALSVLFPGTEFLNSQRIDRGPGWPSSCQKLAVARQTARLRVKGDVIT